MITDICTFDFRDRPTSMVINICPDYLFQIKDLSDKEILNNLLHHTIKGLGYDVKMIPFYRDIDQNPLIERFKYNL